MCNSCGKEGLKSLNKIMLGSSKVRCVMPCLWDMVPYLSLKKSRVVIPVVYYPPEVSLGVYCGLSTASSVFLILALFVFIS